MDETLVCLTATLYGGAADEALFERLEELYLTHASDGVVFALLADLTPAERKRTERDGELIDRARRRLAHLEHAYGNHFALFVRGRRHTPSGEYRSFGGQGGALRELCRYLRGEDMSFLTCQRRLDPASVKRLVALDRTVILGTGAMEALLRAVGASVPKLRGGEHPLCLACSVEAYLQKTAVCEAALRSLPLVERLLDAEKISCKVACDAPKGAVAECMAVYRRMCGDVGGIRGCFPKLRGPSGEKRANMLSGRDRRALFVGFLRSSLPLAGVLLLFIASWVGKWRWTALFFALLPAWSILVRDIAFFVPRRGLCGVLRAVERAFRQAVALAYEAYLFAYALFTADRDVSTEPPRDQLHVDDALLRFSPSMMIGIVLFCLPGGAARLMGALWMAAPLFFYHWSKAPHRGRLCREDRETLLCYAGRMWMYFRDHAKDDTHHLPPSHLRLFPSDASSDAVTPSDIGCYLGALLSARELGLIESEAFYGRCASVTDTLRSLYRWHGHLFAEYHMRTLAPFGTPRISTEESGFFLASLVTFASGLREYAREDPRLLSFASALDAMFEETELDIMFDGKEGLFFREYDAQHAVYKGHHRELFGGGALMLYLAVATGQAPRSAWDVPLRTPAGTSFFRGLVTENGASEDVFLPRLFLPHTAGLLADVGGFFCREERKYAVRRRIFGKRMGFFGRGRAPYFHFDEDADYLSSRFGFPALADGECRGEDVLAPHAGLLLWEAAPNGVMSLCKSLTRAGALGKYGFYDALDLDAGRVGRGYAVIRRFSARGCGLGLLAILNALTDGVLRRRFLRMPALRAFSHVIFEELPSGKRMDRPREGSAPSETYPAPRKEKDRPRYAHTLLHPNCALLSNNQTRLLASSGGHLAVYSGSLCILPSSFDLFSFGSGFRGEAVVRGRALPLVPLGRQDKNVSFFFLPRSDEILFRGEHQLGGRRPETSLRLHVAAQKELFRLTLAVKGVGKARSLRCVFSPSLRREGEALSPLRMEKRDSERVAIFSRGAEAGVYLAVRYPPRTEVTLTSEGEVVCKADVGRLELLFAVSDDEDEAVYMLSSQAAYFDGGALRDLQYRAAGLSFSPWEGERFLLRSFLFGQIRPRMESYARPDGGVLSRAGISGGAPMVLASGYSDLPEQRERLGALIALFKFMCIRGIRFRLVVLHKEQSDSTRRQLKRMGCEELVSYQAGIYLINVTTLSGAERFALELFACAVIDLSRSLREQFGENARAIPLAPETEKLLLQEPVSDDGRGCSAMLPEPPLRSTYWNDMLLTEEELLLLRIRSRDGFSDHDLLAGAWRALSASAAVCEGVVEGVHVLTEMHWDGAGEKQLTVTLTTESEVRLSLIFGGIPVLGKKKYPPRFYRFRRDDGRLLVSRFSENSTPDIMLSASLPCQPITERAALRSDGAVFRGENDLAALMTSMHLKGTATVHFTLTGADGDGAQRYAEI